MYFFERKNFWKRDLQGRWILEEVGEESGERTGRLDLVGSSCSNFTGKEPFKSIPGGETVTYLRVICQNEKVSCIVLRSLY